MLTVYKVDDGKWVAARPDTFEQLTADDLARCDADSRPLVLYRATMPARGMHRPRSPLQLAGHPAVGEVRV